VCSVRQELDAADRAEVWALTAWIAEVLVDDSEERGFFLFCLKNIRGFGYKRFCGPP
jgi:hypothetical protein